MIEFPTLDICKHYRNPEDVIEMGLGGLTFTYLELLNTLLSESNRYLIIQ